MIGTKSTIDCLRTSFGRIWSRHSSRVGPIQRSFRWLGPSLWWIAYVPLFGGSGPDIIQEIGPIHKVIQMIGTESLMDCLCTSLGRIRSWRSSRVVGRHLVNHGDDRNLWSSLHGDFKMSLFKRNFENELNFPFKTLWCINFSLQCGVLVSFEKNHFFLFQMSKR